MEHPAALAIDLGGHTISAALVENGKIRHISEEETHASRELAPVTRQIRYLLDSFDVPEAPLGIGVPGFLDSSREILHSSPNFPTWRKVPLREYWQQELGRKVLVENDANCYALGEGFAGEARGMKNYAVFTLGTGIGGGLVSEGRLIKGHHGMGGETGHIWTNHERLCGGGCAGKGHLESLAGADGIAKTARALGLPEDVKTFWSLRKEDPRAFEAWETVLTHLGGAIASVMHLLDPQVVVLGGGISQAPGLKEALEEKILPLLALPFRDVLNVRISSLRKEAPLFGGASLWMKNLS
ncbi:MAG TPA: ROK family protein [Synergistaceae bacterium]|nr:ROK family protein [Synergistaceae bacterium]HPQ38165.1 ROK family protein [Synergistaceae bacterium]